jgi:hypothetical protein
MAQLTADTIRNYEDGIYGDVPVKSSSTIYRGSAVGMTSGYARQLTAGDVFLGFATAKAVGTSTDGEVNVNIQRAGFIQLAVTSVAVTDIGKPVYASDGNTFTLTQSTNSRVGTVARFVSTGVAIVRFDAQRSYGLTGITALTDSSGGTANNTVQAIGGVFSQSEIANNFADVTGKINEIIAALR